MKKFEITEEQIVVIGNVLGEIAAKHSVPAIDILRSLKEIVDATVDFIEPKKSPSTINPMQ